MISSATTPALADAYGDLIRRLTTPGLDLATVRDIFSQVVQAQSTEPTGVGYAEGRIADRDVIWCTPTGVRTRSVIVYLHGGGYRALGPATVRKLCGHLAAAAGLPVIAASYRLAPEHPWPAALQDATAVLTELRAAGRAVILAGESAGASLALSTALLARGGAHTPAGVIAFSPYLDLFGEDAAFADPASRDRLLSRAVVEDGARMLLGEGTAADDPLANLRYADPRDLPPLLLIAGGEENLAPGIAAFAARAAARSVAVEQIVVDGRQHAHVYAAGRDPEADATLAAAGRWAANLVS